MKKSREQEQ